MQTSYYKYSSKKLITFFLLIVSLCIAQSFSFAAYATEISDQDNSWIEIEAKLSEELLDANIRYIWVVISKGGVIRALELLPENNFYLKSVIEPGEYAIEKISVVADTELDYTTNAPETLSITSDQEKITTLSVDIDGKPTLFSPASSQMPLDGEKTDGKNNGLLALVDSIKEVKPKLSTGYVTIIIFLILCVIMLYLKIRKGNTNNE